MSEQLITDDPAVVGEMAAPAIEPEYGLGEVGHEPANDLPANDLCCRRLGCANWRVFDENTGKRWPYCQGNYCPNIGTGFGAQRISISNALRRVANSPLFYSSPPTLRPGLPNQFVPPPVTNFKQVYRPFDSVPQPNMLAIEHELEKSSDEDPMRRIQLLDEILKGTAPLNLITPHKEIHGFCNSIDDEEFVWDMPVPASYGQRKCARHECRNAAYIWPKDFTKFGSYCSSRCYWMEVETLNETRITALSEDNMEYCRISDRFRSEIPSARIVQIFQLQMPRIIAQRYKTYRLCMAKKSNSSMASITHRMFHGTKSICSLLRLCVQGSGFCPDNCPMCGIAKTGNQKRYSRRTVKRLWFASTPAISYRYCTDGPTKAMFVVDVVAPECGNIIVVDQDEATLPRFLVIFQ